jgi:hypothetical protein
MTNIAICMIPTIRKGIGASAYVRIVAKNIELFGLDVRKNQDPTSAIKTHMEGYGLKRFKVHPTKEPSIFVVEIKQPQAPAKSGEVIRIKQLPHVINRLHKADKLPSGADGIIAIQEVASKLKPAKALLARAKKKAKKKAA